MTLAEFLLARIAEDELLSRGAWPASWMADVKAVHLAECEAKRRIVGMYEATTQARLALPAATLEDVLSELAVPYAEHPDYDEAWRP